MDHKVTVTSSAGTVTYYIMEIPNSNRKEDKHMNSPEVLNRLHEIALEEDVLIAELWLCAQAQGYV